MQRIGQKLLGPSDFYEGYTSFKRERFKHDWTYDWADLPQWERKQWAERERNGQKH
jgi:hypothetical protein